MSIIKKILGPIYEEYRHIVDTRSSKILFDINGLSKIFANTIDDNKKIKIRISHYSGATWNSLKSLVDELSNDDRCDVLIILSKDDEKMRKQAIEASVPYVFACDYDVSKDRPDALILSHAMDDTFTRDQRKHIRKVFVVSAALIHYFKDIDEYIRIAQIRYGDLEPDYYIYDKSMYSELSEIDVYGGKLVCMGNPKFDGIYEAVNSKEIDKRAKKLIGKKTVLWATDHGVQYGKIAADFAFAEYASFIFSYFLEHNDMGLIFRPHSTFIEEMIRHGYWSQKEIDELKNRFLRTDNIIWDENDSYDMAYSMCDAIITDCHCGIICSALPTLKPIALLYKSPDIESINEELESCQYPIYSTKELEAFLIDVKEGKDLKRLLREEINSKMICSFDGNNGKRISEYIISECMKE